MTENSSDNNLGSEVRGDLAKAMAETERQRQRTWKGPPFTSKRTGAAYNAA